jgi:hypothetical protein
MGRRVFTCTEHFGTVDGKLLVLSYIVKEMNRKAGREVVRMKPEAEQELYRQLAEAEERKSKSRNRD